MSSQATLVTKGPQNKATFFATLFFETQQGLLQAQLHALSVVHMSVAVVK